MSGKVKTSDRICVIITKIIWCMTLLHCCTIDPVTLTPLELHKILGRKTIHI